MESMKFCGCQGCSLYEMRNSVGKVCKRKAKLVGGNLSSC